MCTTHSGSVQNGDISVKILNPAMGVPISFLDKYCPEQFEIVRFRHGDDDKDLRYTDINGSVKIPYFRVLIRYVDFDKE